MDGHLFFEVGFLCGSPVCNTGSPVWLQYSRPAGKSSFEISRAYLCPLFLRRQLDSPSLLPAPLPPRFYLTIYSSELDLLDPLRLPNLSLISMDQAISRPRWCVNCDPRVSSKMRMSHKSKYCFSALYTPPNSRLHREQEPQTQGMTTWLTPGLSWMGYVALGTTSQTRSVNVRD